MSLGVSKAAVARIAAIVLALTTPLTMLTPSAADAQEASALVEIAPGDGIDASTFIAGSFRVTNTSTGGQKIARVTYDLSFALFPDMVFDPVGTAGDQSAKCITVDSGAASTGYVTPADPCSTPYSSPHDGGFDAAELAFTDFGPGEVIAFSADVDPTSIKGTTADVAAGHPGFISGVELSGTLVTIEFDDGQVISGQVFRVTGSAGSSEVSVVSNGPAAPHVEALGTPSTPAVVNAPEQSMRITGPAGATVRLLQVEGDLDLAGTGGFDLDAFEANRAVAVTESTATIGDDGSVDIGVVLTRSEGSAGLNLFQAVLVGADAETGAVSPTLVLQLGPACTDSADCEDSNPCTDDLCTSDGCTYQFNDAACNDGLACTTGDVCAGGTCAGTPTCPSGSTCSSSTGTCVDAVISFGKSVLTGAVITKPTSLQFGPDGRLYVSQQDGLIRIFKVNRTGPNQYSVTSTADITSIQSIPNHNDDGTPNTKVKTRLVTGIFVGGTAAHPIIWTTSTDPRIGGGDSATDLNLDTNSGIVSRLTWNGSTWVKTDLVRGLPRSEENHAGNGMFVDEAAGIAYLAYAGNTNMGATSNNFAFLPEFAYSAAILSIDLTRIGDTTLDLPTLNDENRPGVDDVNDPFGGDNGRNQAILEPDSPVQVYAPGFRNPYDVIVTQAGRMYTIDNGANAAWGDIPVGNGTASCTNGVSEPGISRDDSLHYVSGRGYYGGHPNPTRGNIANTFNTSNPQPAVSTSNPIECTSLDPGPENGALLTFLYSTNGLAEYNASNFGNQLKGNLLAAGWNNVIWRIQLNSTGTAVKKADALFSNVGEKPLDVIAQGNSGPFPGTIWVAEWKLGQIIVYEPVDATSCTGANDAALDEDGDGYRNDDEISNGTDPCSSADVPPDADHDWISNRNDPDDDNDGIPDTSDRFARDPANGTATKVPFLYDWENDSPDVGGILDLGFSGLMTNTTDDYEALYDESKMTTGGAAGVLTIDSISSFDALGAQNDQRYAFQLGIPGTWSDLYTVHTRIVGPFLGVDTQAGQSMGLFIGVGGQNNYFKIVTAADNGGMVETLKEIVGTATFGAETPLAMPGPDAVDLYLEIDSVTHTVQPAFAITVDGSTGPTVLVGQRETIPATWIDDPDSGLAVGIIATSGGAPAFPATWDLLEARAGGLEQTSTTLPPTSTLPPTTTTVPVTTTTAPVTTTIVPVTTTTVPVTTTIVPVTTTVTATTTTTLVDQCAVDEDCDDGDPCTTDTCSSAVCLHATLSGTPCDDGFFCTVHDTCGAGGCVGTPRECGGDGQCSTSTCDESRGECTSAARNDGTPCEDGNACTTDDSCASGSCVATSYCGVPATRGATPLATDAQYILKAAVGAIAGQPCECDVNSDGRISAADALTTLQAAVGTDVPLVCFQAAEQTGLSLGKIKPPRSSR